MYSRYHFKPRPSFLKHSLTSAAKIHRIVQKWLKLNTGLKELSRHLCHLRWAIEELRDVLNSAFDPLGINVDAQENGTADEAKDEVAVEGDKKTDTPSMTQAGGLHVSSGPELYSEQWADFTGCWKAHGSDRQS